MGKKKKQPQMPKRAATLRGDLLVAVDIFAGYKGKVLNVLLTSGHGVQGRVGDESSDHVIVLYNADDIPMWVDIGHVLAFSLVDPPEDG